MTGTLIGYFPKRYITRAGWVSPLEGYPDAPFPAASVADEICSVSRCIAKGPDLRWGVDPINELDGFASPDKAPMRRDRAPAGFRPVRLSTLRGVLRRRAGTSARTARTGGHASARVLRTPGLRRRGADGGFQLGLLAPVV